MSFDNDDFDDMSDVDDMCYSDVEEEEEDEEWEEGSNCFDDGLDVPIEKEQEVDTREQKIIQGANLMPRIDDIVARANNVLDTTAINCRMLLFQFRWKDDVLVERFTEGNDIAQLLKASKVSPSEGKPLPLVSGECELCCDDSGDVVRFSCGTQVCKACFDRYLSEKIHENGAAFISCPGYKCSQLIDDDAIKKYCSDKEGYQKVVINSYVLANSQMKWCPGTDCARVIEVAWTPNDRFTKTVQCDCGKTFCFNCYGERHEPVSCGILRKWQQKSADDSETLNWISVNTKTCPKCRNMIEKNGGCNHMTCRQPGCGHEFCWICYADWKGHNYECRKFAADPGGKRSKAEADLKKFLFYDNLYTTHKKSISANKQLYERVHAMREKIMNIQGILTYQELDFVIKSVDSLLKCRTTLMYTYAFAFYLEDSMEKTIFEDNQIDLEKAVEELNGYLEKEDLEDEDIKLLKQNIINKSAYLEKRRHALLDHVRQGEEADTWKFVDY
ncbi:hypothetical protein QR680_011225 [Steinernema hermaphroditum]|uniref:RBR-type E3 ubiquitin transferase n=1 Tax=Steinernema hermaphroditum TaxID=289476 RepID=A0AA39MD43_9BILA|nr:hypothetical protein QR680_011225 [Steinernema hermaphroditum]